MVRVFAVVFAAEFEKQEQRGEGIGREQQVRGADAPACAGAAFSRVGARRRGTSPASQRGWGLRCRAGS